MDGSDVELESENSLTSSPRQPRKNITLKLKSEKSTGRGRPRKGKSSKHGDEDLGETEVLDTPIFKTMDQGEPVHDNKKLRWDHKVNLLGEKVLDPLIHCCEICSLPILIYGRMIQCKHVFCFTCAKKTEKTCPRCNDPVQRIEQSALGTVFLCTYGGSKHGQNGCRRTYLSQRDLNAHIAHRHLKSEFKEGGPAQKVAAPPQLKTSAPAVQSHQAIIDQFSAVMRQASAATNVVQRPADSGYLHGPGLSLGLPVSSGYPPTEMPNVSHMSVVSQSQTSAPQDNYTSAIPVLGSRIKTIISVPLQDDDQYTKKHPSYAPSQPVASAMPNMNYPPPSFPVGSMAPNIHQPPLNIPPPMFSSQAVQPGLSASFTSPPPQMMTAGPTRAPPRMTVPPTGPPQRYFDNPPTRGPWTGGPRASNVPPQHQRGPPRADFNYY